MSPAEDSWVRANVSARLCIRSKVVQKKTNRDVNNIVCGVNTWTPADKEIPRAASRRAATMLAELGGPVLKSSDMKTLLYTVMFPATSRSSAGNVRFDAPMSKIKTVSQLELHASP